MAVEHTPPIPPLRKDFSAEGGLSTFYQECKDEQKWEKGTIRLGLEMAENQGQ